MFEPWKTDNWWVSPYNFDPQVLGDKKLTAPILHDVTLRDGEENAGLVFNLDDKIKLAKALDAAGLPRIEMLITSPGAEEAIKTVLDLGLKAKIYAAGALVKQSNMEKALRTGVQFITVAIRTSDLQIQTFTDKTREGVLQNMLDTIYTAKEHGLYFNLFLADCPRADLGFLEEICLRCKEAGVDSITVVDSVGTAIPQTIAFLVGKIIQWTGLPIEVHTHNDYGLGMATSLAGWEAGAGAIHVAVNSLGYRCGNPATEEMVLALEALYGAHTGVKLDALYGLSALAQETSGQPVAFNKPISGPGAFAYERYAEIQKAAQLGKPMAVLPYNPQAVGRKPIFILSKWSDIEMVKHKLSELGHSLNDEQATVILQKVKEISMEKKRPVNDDEIQSLLD
jgi:isopropylmalate/homocitrate/citramalate synthase